MSETTSKHPPSSPPRPGHGLHRSITEVSPPTQRQRAHHHHHHHHHSRNNSTNQPHQINTRRARSSEKDREREPQSAHPNLQPFLSGDTKWRDGVKSEFGTPVESRNASRRQSVWETGLDGAIVLGIGAPRKVIKEGEVKKEWERGVLRAKELRTSLTSLHTQSNDTTRRLDTTYYSVLEKLSVLQSSISSLKEIAFLTRTIITDFQSESAELGTEITSQLESFSNFSSQETRIQDLAQRVWEGRTKIKSLGERVDVVKKRVEGWERAEGEWQDKTRRRLRVMWIVMSLIAGLVLGLVVFRYTPARVHGPGVMKGLNASELVRRIPGFEEEGNLTWSKHRKNEGQGVLERLKEGQEEKGEDDGRLRVFDEL